MAEQELPTVINVQVTVSYVVEGVLDSLDEEDQNLEGVLNWIEQNAEEDLSQCIGNYNVLDENGQEVQA